MISTLRLLLPVKGGTLWVADVPPAANPDLGAGCAGICIKFEPMVREDSRTIAPDCDYQAEENQDTAATGQPGEAALTAKQPHMYTLKTTSVCAGRWAVDAVASSVR